MYRVYEMLVYVSWSTLACYAGLSALRWEFWAFIAPFLLFYCLDMETRNKAIIADANDIARKANDLSAAMDKRREVLGWLIGEIKRKRIERAWKDHPSLKEAKDETASPIN